MVDLCSQDRTETIYYEFDKGQSPETRATIGRLLDIGEFCDVGNILVVGHTDTSGSASYNLALSRRRAADARSELVRQGINPDIIRSEGRGETQPFVQTGDGVREQLNRRTEVIVSLANPGVVRNMNRNANTGSMMSSGSMSSGSMSSGSMSSGSMSTTTSGAVFTDSEGNPMRQNPDGSFSRIR